MRKNTRNGRYGSYNLFWKGVWISSFPINHKIQIAHYYFTGEELILDTFQNPELKHLSLKTHKKCYLHFCEMMYLRKKNGDKIPTEDHEKLLACVMALEKLKVIDSENDGQTGYYIGIKKKKIRHFKHNRYEISRI